MATSNAIGVGSGSTSLAETLLEQGVAACLAEYQALTGEMNWLREEASQYQRLSVALLVGLVPLLGLVASTSPDLLIPALLLIPFPFAVLGYLFFRQHEEVYVIAAYLREEVRPQIRRLTALPSIWGWEEFKDARFSSGRRGFLGMISSGKMALGMRILLFLLPAIVSTIAAVVVVLWRNPTALLETHGWAIGWLAIAGLVVDVLLIGILIGFLWSHGDLAARLLAVKSPDSGSGR